MTAETVVFIVFAVASVAGGLVMVLARNAVYSAIGLLTAMFSMAVFYVLNDAHFVAVVQVIIYAGAVMTLFLFVIMLIGVDRDEDTAEQIPLQRPLGLMLAGGLLILSARRRRSHLVQRPGAGRSRWRHQRHDRSHLRAALRHVDDPFPGHRAAAHRCRRRHHRPRPVQPPPP